jgi:hypothetical protein
MPRLAHLFSSLAAAGVLTGAIIAACGRPGAPGEIPRLPPPEGIGPSARPQPGPSSRLLGGRDAGTRLSPGPVSTALVVPMPTFQAAAEPADAGVSDDGGSSATAPDAAAAIDAPGAVDAARPPSPPDAAADGPLAPLPPIPDGGLPADSRLEPAVRAN